MLFTYTFLKNHPVNKLNQHVIFFFRKLRSVDNTSNFNPINNYFHPDFVTQLNRADELRNKFELFFDAYKNLPNNDKQRVYTIFAQTQDIKNILESIAVNGNSLKLSGLPAGIRNTIKDLFSFLYSSKIKGTASFHDHYEQSYNDFCINRKFKVCPFCGIEGLFPPHIRRQDYDHILSQEFYPLMSVNMKNLVPTGRDCNQIFKFRKDVLYHPNTGNRRVFAFPFQRSYQIKISLNSSTLPNTRNRAGIWNIALNPQNDYVETWENVYDIKRRYSEMVLAIFFDEWLIQFEESIRKSRARLTSRKNLKSEFRICAEIYLNQPHIEFGIIKGALFKFLANCNDNLFYDSILQKINN
ncbi:MAG TPA: hypothetical protein PKC72_08910 [Chitinophagaceae bacterium]|nr:hypothetical protein [Chitinophagaceae bacterium]